MPLPKRVKIVEVGPGRDRAGARRGVVRRRGGGVDPVRQVAQADLRLGSQQDHLLHHVDDFPHVAGPVVAVEGGQRLGGDAGQPPAQPQG